MIKSIDFKSNPITKNSPDVDTDGLPVEYVGDRHVVFSGGELRDRRIGIYLEGGCDIRSLFYCVPMIQPILNGTCCITRNQMAIDKTRSDVLLQTLQNYPSELLAPTIEKLKLSPDYFQIKLFDPTFTVEGATGSEEFPKTAIIMSVGADVIRTVYRHRTHGFLVDPGGYWLNQSMDTVLKDLSVATWFKRNFVSVGQISVEEFMDNFTQIIQLIRQRTEAHILVFNILSLQSGEQIHNYQFVKNSQSMRRREFNLALVELSRKLNFSIVDLDRILRKAGIEEMYDFAHFPNELNLPIAREVFRIMQELEIFI
ncbi:SGNH/GDSL hydrolase family protein [Laspinema olomoucense]|uniref:SGNH/GDSL hydrolase family protein n=1 Tax=Laspinema olomoucense TaxID=3231600 RepID=UPI0021BA3D68|nr:SGNH/GDSL hydrolase family protein [Laspinema sp. D3a]MCT7989004.1 SGNH/GDSL hydrolase family protein [Laspinema sp. D3a]